MSRLFDEMPEELKALFGNGGISPTDFSQKRENTFDYDNPPVTNEEFETLIPAEALMKLVEARKLLIEAKDTLQADTPALAEVKAMRLSKASPYTQIQYMFFTDDLQKALTEVNTLLHINDPDMELKKTLDEQAEEQGISVRELAQGIIHKMMLDKMLEELSSILG